MLSVVPDAGVGRESVTVLENSHDIRDAAEVGTRVVFKTTKKPHRTVMGTFNDNTQPLHRR
jgi:hypothetical protein